jgi:O-succinylbenzoate synthase
MTLPPLQQLLADARVVSLPLKKNFRGIDHREFVIFEGPAGWGEFAPFHDHTLDHCAQWLVAAIEAAYEGFPASVRSDVAVNAIVPALPLSEIEGWVQSALTNFGTRVFKVKCGDADFRKDYERVDEIRYTLDHTVGDDWSLRLDVNGQWSVDQAIERIKVLNDAAAGRIEYVEQPVQSLADCATVRAATDVKIAVDESIRLVSEGQLSPYAVRLAADVAIVKAIPLGGVRKSLNVVESLQLPVVVSGSMDSSIGLASGLALAGIVPELFGACGFGTGQLLADDFVHKTSLPINGRMSVQSPQVDVAAIERAESRVDSATVNYWKARLTACYELLEEM